MVGVLLFLPFFASDGEWRPRREVTATFVGLRSVRETLIQFVSQIFENNDLAFFEAAIDTPPVPKPLSPNVSASYLKLF
jgi:hypothetical protein